MLSEKLTESLNAQLHWELYSSYIYLSMSAYYANLGLLGFASWMKYQSAEETTHAMKIYNYILDRGGKVDLRTVEAPPATWPSAEAAMEEALEHERGVTKRINDLMELSMAEKDHAAHSFLNWFIDEQVEEEASVGDILAKLKLAGECGGLYMVDKELGERTFTIPADL